MGGMKRPPGHRKRIPQYHDPGHIHELTFSCFHRWPLLTNDYLQHNPVRRGLVKRAVDCKRSSASYYLLDPPRQYSGLPTVHSLPAEWLDESH